MRWFTTIAALLCLNLQRVFSTDVFAHFMMQNAWSYDGGQWIKDIQAARDVGIDGFIVNVIPPYCAGDTTWQFARAYDAFAVASYLQFKMILSFDMSYTQCTQFWTPDVMLQAVKNLSALPSAYRWNSNILVTTFGGDMPQYGDSFLQSFKNLARSQGIGISLAPALTTISNNAQFDVTTVSALNQWNSIDGYMNWQAWPLDQYKNMTTAVDQAFQTQLRNTGKTGPYIMSVSPWQYKDLNNGNTQASWVQYSDFLWYQRWESLVGPNAFKPDIVQITSWNDFGESHYLRDLPSTDPLAPDYVNLGQMGNYISATDHSPWRTMAQYYISWMKTGSAPTPTADNVIVWYRQHPKQISCSSGASVPIRNSQLPEDAVFLWAVVTADSTISSSVGSSLYNTFHATSSRPTVSSVQFPPETYFGVGVTPEVAIMRNGAVQQVNRGSNVISNACAYEDYNPSVFLVGPGANF